VPLDDQQDMILMIAKLFLESESFGGSLMPYLRVNALI